ncbi:choline/ethanolamine kinase family protein [Peloplasma aerotolerans]|uniref:Choline/ethanolamine kinase family protein n=1 Tax=Peloplasma aerotolerans TaxID=3044389 RepID=A0AAW6U9M4_9MOLU|nr:choline/ethanolamine kinase family protein [Mariniplasma sp. M4Ah]MDI6452349.1 choline/ethanolamine kinase family protein [Mariniplasma sp. M4Ah]
MEYEQLIKTQAAKAFHVKKEDVNVINRLMGGMSHLTYHIRIRDIDYTYRIIGKDGNLFVDREVEYQNLKIIESLELNNETVYFDIETGEKAAKYVEGTVLSTVDFHPYLEEVAKTLKKLHHSDVSPASDYGLIQRLELYESYTNMRTPLYQELKEKWISLYQEKHQNQQKVFCHNDAQRSNIVVGNDRIYLLDWEYAGLNEFYYDIASFGNVKFEDALVLLDVYLNREATLDEKNSVRFYRMFQALQWHQVALRKEMIGLSEVLQFDFKVLALKYLNLANTLYQQIKG